MALKTFTLAEYTVAKPTLSLGTTVKIADPDLSAAQIAILGADPLVDYIRISPIKLNVAQFNQASSKLNAQDLITIVDTSVNIQNSLSALLADAKIDRIDSVENVMPIKLTVAQALDANNIAKLQLGDNVQVADTTANIQANLDALLAISKIDRIDSTENDVAIIRNVDQVTAQGSALKLQAGDTITVIDSSAAINAQIDRLLAAGKVDNIDSSENDVAINISATAAANPANLLKLQATDTVNVILTGADALTAEQIATIAADPNVDAVIDMRPTLAAATASVDEGSSLTFNITHAAPNTIYAYYATDAADVAVSSDLSSPALAVVKTDADGNATFTIDVTADIKTEGAETMKVTLLATNMSTTAVINDTSLDNVPPVVDATQVIAITEDTASDVISITATDENNDVLTYTPSAAANGVVTAGPTDGTFIYTPNANVNGADSFVVTVTDPNGGIAMQTVNLTIAAVNDAPTVTATTLVAGTEDTAYTINASDILANATDVDGDTLTITALTVDAAKGAIVNNGNGTYTFTPVANVNGQVDFTATISDGTATADTTASLNLAAVNDAPTATAIANQAAKQATAFSFNASSAFSDVDGDTTLTYSIDPANPLPAGLTLDTATGIISGTPLVAAIGTKAVTVVATDSANATTSNTFNIVTENAAPFVADDPSAGVTFTALSGVATSFDVLTNDGNEAGDALTLTVNQPALGGLVEVTTVNGQNVIKFTSTPGFGSAAGVPVTFTYTLTDSLGLVSALATVTVNVKTQLGGTPGPDNLIGSTSAEALQGGDGNDTINGGGGLDTISGDAGDDTIYFYGNESGINGGVGVDTLVLTSASSALFGIDLSVSSNQAYRFQDSDGDSVLHESNDLTATSIASFENLDASASNVDLVIDNLVDTNAAGEGGRTLTDGPTLGVTGGDNVSSTSIKTGSGTDQIQVGNHIAALGVWAGAGNDTINAYGTVATSIFGEAGIDTITAFGGAITADGGAGADNITGLAGNDSLLGGADNDTINTGNGNNTAAGGDGNDTITAGNGADSLLGDVGNDTFVMAGNLAAVAPFDTIDGGDGIDTIGVNISTTDVAFTKVTKVEAVTLGGAGTTLTLDTLAVAAGINTVSETAGTLQTFDVNRATFTNDLTVNLNTNEADVVNATAYTKNLTVRTTSATGLTTAVIMGGTGLADQIVYDLTAASATQAANAGITAIEKITTAGSTTNSLTVNLDDANAAANITFTIDGSALTTGVLTANTTAETNGKVVVLGGGGNDAISGSRSVNGDSLSGALGNDTFFFDNDAGVNRLGATDTVSGGDGTDTVSVNSATVDAAFTKVTSVEGVTVVGASTLTLGAFAAAAGVNTVTQTAGTVQTFNVGADFTNNLTAVLNTNEADVVNAATYTKNLTVTTTSATGLTTAVITGGTGTADQIVYDLTAASAVQASNAGITAIEKIATAGSTTNSLAVTLNNANAAANATLTVDGSALTTGVLTADASAEVDGKVVVLGGGANDVITGSASANGDNLSGAAGNDTFVMAANLTATDTVSGGDGTDTVTVSAATVDAAFTKATSVENVTVAGANALTLGVFAAAAGVNTVTQTAGTVQTFNVGADFTNNLTTVLNTNEADVVNAATYTKNLTVTTTSATGLTTAVITGGTGTADQIVYDLTAAPATQVSNAGITAIEKIATTGSTTNGLNVTLANTNAAVNATLTVDGSVLTTGVLTVNASAELDGKVVVLGGAANDVITGSASTNGDNLTGNAGDDQFLFAAVGNFTSADTVSGGTNTTVGDTLSFVNAVVEADTTLVDSAFAGVSGIEVLNGWTNNDAANNSANSVTSTISLATNAQNAGITTVNLSATDGSTVQGVADTYNFVVDASGYTSAIKVNTNHAAQVAGNTLNVQVGTGSGNDTITAGAGDDSVTVNGGAGADTIAFGAAGTGSVLWNLGSHLAAGTIATNADIITGFTQGTDKIEFLGGVLQSGVGGQIVLSSAGDSLASVADVTTITNLNEAAELSSLASGADASAYVLNVDLDTEMGTAVFVSGGVVSQAGIDAALAQLQPLVTTTVANTNIVFALDDGISTALVQYKELGTSGIQAGELTLIGVLDTTVALTAVDFT